MTQTTDRLEQRTMQVLADVVSEVVIDTPRDELDLSYWVYQMSDRDYRECARGHIAGASSPLPGGARSSINVESVGGHLLVQHYEPEILEPHHIRMISHASEMWIFRLIPSRVKVIWDVSLHENGEGGCTFRDHIRVEHRSRLIGFLSRVALINRVVQKHDDEETPAFARNLVEVCARRERSRTD
ncbi:MAG: hypothetical protein DWQ29_01285 [Planctomycetota bacterium]|nr:MAG: hypothetical protein DWQ29_01285 [Planctomycetota bacterium]